MLPRFHLESYFLGGSLCPTIYHMAACPFLKCVATLMDSNVSFYSRERERREEGDDRRRKKGKDGGREKEGRREPRHAKFKSPHFVLLTKPQTSLHHSQGLRLGLCQATAEHKARRKALFLTGESKEYNSSSLPTFQPQGIIM